MASNARAFQRAHSPEEEPMGAMQRIGRAIDEGFVATFPEMVLEFPRKAMYTVGVLINVATLGLFFYFLISSYNSNVSSVFLSPSPAAGDCDSVLIPGNGNFLADTNGYWDSSQYFASSQAIYSFTMRQFLCDPVTCFPKNMWALAGAVQAVGDTMVNNTLSDNLLVWTSWSTSLIIGGTTQTVTFTGDPAVVFNTNYVVGSSSDLRNDCNASSVVSFDPANYLLSITYSYSEYITDEACMAVVDPAVLGYSTIYDDDEFLVGIDVRSLVTALTVNGQITFIDGLRELPSSAYNYTYKGVQYYTSSYYDEQYPGMAPITCLTGVSNWTSSDPFSPMCYFEYRNNVFALPLFNHFGYSYEYPSYCACDGGLGPGATNPACDAFMLMAGILFYNEEIDYDSDDVVGEPENPLLNLALKNGGLKQLNELAYEAMYISMQTIISGNYSYEKNASAREQAFAFCNQTDVGLGGCSVLTFGLNNDKNTAVSSLYYNLNKGSCTNSVSINVTDFQRMIDTPPTPLQQDYYTCRPRPKDSLINALGVTSGSISTMTPFMVLFFVNAYIFVLLVQGKEVKQTYSKAERDEALQAFALQLLMMRDNRLKRTRRSSLHRRAFESHAAGAAGAGYGGRISSVSSDSEAHLKAGSGTNANPTTAEANASVLRLLTDELMANAYIDPYFRRHLPQCKDKDKDKDRGRERGYGDSMNPMVGGRAASTTSASGDAIELGSLEKRSSSASTSSSSGGAAVRRSDRPKDKPKMQVLNDCFVDTSDASRGRGKDGADNSAITEFARGAGAGAGNDGPGAAAVSGRSSEGRGDSVRGRVAKLAEITEQLVGRLVSAVEDGGNFWSVAPLTAVLRCCPGDLDELFALWLEDVGNNARGRSEEGGEEFEVKFVELLRNVYQLLQVHACVVHGCTEEEALALHGGGTGYYVGGGSKAYSLQQVGMLFNRATACLEDVQD